jgi:hypothetical protein
MSAAPLDLTAARFMDPARVTDREGRWQLRQLLTDEHHVCLLSDRAPAGTAARDLQPITIEIASETDDGFVLPVDQLREFLTWPPTDVCRYGPSDDGIRYCEACGYAEGSRSVEGDGHFACSGVHGVLGPSIP